MQKRTDLKQYRKKECQQNFPRILAHSILKLKAGVVVRRDSFAYHESPDSETAPE